MIDLHLPPRPSLWTPPRPGIMRVADREELRKWLSSADRRFDAGHFMFGTSMASVNPYFQPAGTTALLRASFQNNVTTFDVNTISGTMGSGIAYNATGGPVPGWGWASGAAVTGYITHTALTGGSANSADFLTIVMWVKSSNSGDTINNYGPRVYLWGWNSGSVWMQLGWSLGRFHIAADERYMVGNEALTDDAWHLVIIRQTAQNAWQFWVDGVLDSQGTTTSTQYGNHNLGNIGGGYTGYTGAVAPAGISAVQVFRPALTESQCKEIFSQAGFAVDTAPRWILGARSGSITISSELTWRNLYPMTNILDGIFAHQGIYVDPDGQAVANKSILKFDFGVGNAPIHKAILSKNTFSNSGAGSFTARWRASNDNSSWTDLTSDFVYDLAGPFVPASFASNNTGYRYYQLYGVSGTIRYYFISEIVFKAVP